MFILPFGLISVVVPGEVYDDSPGILCHNSISIGKLLLLITVNVTLPQ